MTPEDTAVVETPPSAEPAEGAPKALYHYSQWVDVGAGAEDCSEVDREAGTNRCGDSGHFHAWCRLPNEIQRREIRERAQAAKARKARQLRQPDTDSNEILEQAIDDLLGSEDAKEQLVDELVGYDYIRDLMVATREARDKDDPDSDPEDPEKLYEHIEDDQARFQTLAASAEEDRNEEELEELKTHLSAYNLEVERQLNEIQQPKRAAWEGMDVTDLADLVRRRRIEQVAMDEFMYHYNIHEWLSCAQQERNGEPVFKNLDHLRSVPEDVITSLAAAFADLERTAQAVGN